VPGDQKLADSVHINSDVRHVCLQLLAADCQARPLSNSCSVHSQQQQTLGSCCADWRALTLCRDGVGVTVAGVSVSGLSFHERIDAGTSVLHLTPGRTAW